MQLWFTQFGKGDESLGDVEHSGWPLEFDNNQLRGSSKLIFLQLHEKTEELNINYSMIIQHLKQIGKVKNFSKRVPHELNKNLKI